MNYQPFLTIVTATRGNFSDYWLEQLLNIHGNVQFLLVYPPGAQIKAIADERVESIVSPYKGEVIQRFTGLINAKGDYVIALDDDDFAHPELAEVTRQYFAKFPESWVLRLKIQNINYTDETRIRQDWEQIPNLGELEVCRKTPENPFPFQGGNYKGLLEIPITPLHKSFDIRYLIFPWKQRTDQNGYHFENFNNKVWKTEIVREALTELSTTMNIKGALTWMPLWNLDRLLGLYIQAKFYQKDAIIGHAPPKPEQIRYIVRDDALKGIRLHVTADILLLKSYPQYGYLWNLIIWQIYIIPQIFAKSLKFRFFSRNQTHQQATSKRIEAS